MQGPCAAALRLLLAALPLCFSGPALAGTAPPAPPTEATRAKVVALIAQAHRLDLGKDLQWLRLGHWRQVPGSGYRSEAEGSDFFLDPRGRTDPAAELDATLKAIFGLTPQPPEELARELMPAVCRFPARLLVLQQRLGFDPAGLVQDDCPKLVDYFRKLQPAGVSLVFSSYYLNNPASAFGHTFLRVQRQGEQLGREKRELLDSAIDYSADVDTGNPIFYALEGLFGFFRGTFKLRPYYYKVREYNDYESRDLFEYQLALTPLEVATFVAHVFELGSTWFAYYYADENCSYHVLAALEAAAPRLRLLEHVGVLAIPADTVKALYFTPGLVQSVTYRPSATTQFEARVAGMTRAQKVLVDELAVNPAAPLPPASSPPEQVPLLDAAADLIDVRFAKDLTFEPDGAAGAKKQRLLARRAALLVPSAELLVPLPVRQPHQAHASARLWASALWSDADGPAAVLGWRITLHSLDDPPGGYPDLAQIQFFPAELRAQTRTGNLVLERLHFLDAISLHAMNLFDHRLSWKIRAGAARVRDAGCKSCLAADFLLGSGAAFALGPLVLFGTADLSVQAGPALQGIEGRGLRAGAGPAGGLRLRLGEHLTWLAEGHAYWLPKAAGPWTWGAESTLRLQLSEALGVGLEGRLLPEAAEAGLRGYWFF